MLFLWLMRRNFLKNILFLSLFFCFRFISQAQDSSTVFVFEIAEEIAEPVWHNLQIAKEQAIEQNATHFIVNMNTYGGGVEMADSIRTAFLRTDIPVYMLINNNAASAGALISIACDKIYMTPGSTIGAATVVTQDGEAAIDKYQSYFRSKMRATAEVTGRNPDIAEAMVDQDIEIEGITKKGKLLTFTVSEAMKHGFCDAEVEDLQALLKLNNLQTANIIHYKPTTVNILISLLINPAVSGILIMIMLGGIYFELQSPGIGFPIAAAAFAAILFFAPLYLEGLAENWEIILFMVGVILLAAEIFVIPGTGIAGILGFSLVLSGLTLSMIENVQFDFTMVSMSGIYTSFSVVIFSMLVSTIMLFLLLPKLLENGKMNAFVVQSEQKTDLGYIAVDESLLNLKGLEGVVLTDLRPSGKVFVNNLPMDATSMGGYIEKGIPIIVVGTEGPQLIVKKIS